MGIIKKVVILIVVLTLVYFLTGLFGSFYVYFFPQPVSSGSLFSIPISESAESDFIGLPLSYIFFLTLLFTAFGGEKKYWWSGILLIPAVAFELYFDLAHIYFPIILGLAGWLSGLLAFKLLTKINKFYAADKTIH